MGVQADCDHCGKSYRRDSSEITNKGTFWNRTFSIKCPFCGAEKSWSARPSSALNKFMAEEIEYAEFWLQRYVKENYKDLGFTAIKGPFGSGPDFRGIINGREVLVEVETSRGNYIAHKHHTDPRFKNVEILIVLGPKLVPEENEENKDLPPQVIYIDKEDFTRWWQPCREKGAVKKRIKNVITLLKNEFENRYVSQCKDKSRDMASCPECDSCAYMQLETAAKLNEMPYEFIMEFNLPVDDEDFEIGTIKAEDIETFFNDRINKVQIP